MAGETDLALLLRNMRAELRSGAYVIVSIAGPPPVGADVEALVREDEATTLVMLQEEADKYGLEYEFVAAWITLNVHSALEAVGFTAAFSAALASAGMSCNVLAGYFHDHILVRSEDAAEALQVLTSLSAGGN